MRDKHEYKSIAEALTMNCYTFGDGNSQEPLTSRELGTLKKMADYAAFHEMTLMGDEVELLSVRLPIAIQDARRREGLAADAELARRIADGQEFIAETKSHHAAYLAGLDSATIERVHEIVMWAFEEHGGDLPGDKDQWWLDAKLQGALGEALKQEKQAAAALDAEHEREADAAYYEQQPDPYAELRDREELRAASEGELDSEEGYNAAYEAAHSGLAKEYEDGDDVPF